MSLSERTDSRQGRMSAFGGIADINKLGSGLLFSRAGEISGRLSPLSCDFKEGSLGDLRQIDVDIRLHGHVVDLCAGWLQMPGQARQAVERLTN